MMNETISPEQRKRTLIAQGEAFRAQVIQAKYDAHAGLHPESIARGAIDHVTTAAIAAFKNGGAARIAGLSLPTVLPLLASGVSALSGRRLLKPIVRTVVVAGVAGAAAMLVLKRKKRATNTADSGQRVPALEPMGKSGLLLHFITAMQNLSHRAR
jgi:hypothetical protein